MRVCSSCGRENPDDRDFCECGEYLRWDPTGVVQAITPEVLQAAQEQTPPAAAEAPAAPAEPGPAAPQQPPPATPPPPAAQPPAAHPAARPAAPQQPASPGNGAGDPLAPAPAQPPARTTQPPAAAPAPKTLEQVPVPPPAAAPAAPAQAAEPDPAAITLRLPEGEQDATDEVLTVGVEPGGRTRLIALVRNQSQIVDNYELSVRGLADDWWSIFPNTVYLVPFGTSGTYEQEVEIHLHPPRSPQAEARLWELEVVAESKAYTKQAAAAPLSLGILPFEEFKTKLSPERASGRKKANFDVAVNNTANGPLTVALDAADQDNELKYQFSPSALEIPPGQTGKAKMQVKPPRTRWMGRPEEKRIQVFTKTGEEADKAKTAADMDLPEGALEDGEEGEGGGLGGQAGEMAKQQTKGLAKRFRHLVRPPRVRVGPGGVQVQKGGLTRPSMPGNRTYDPTKLRKPGMGGPAVPSMPLMPNQVVFRHKAWLPWWIALLIPFLLILALLLFLFLPRNVVVPDVTGSKSAFEAEKKLTKAQLKLAPTPKEKVSTSAAPGTVIGQTPSAGEKAKKDSEVTVEVAVGNGKVQVPDLVGKTQAEADPILEKVNLSIGGVQPQPPDPKAKIASQIPGAKEVVKEGKPIQIFLETIKDKKKGKKDKKENGGGGGGGGAKAAAVTLPALGGAVADAAQAAADAGVVPIKVTEFSPKKKGAVIRTEPPAGTKLKAGDKVKIVVSGGFPQLTYDDGKNILLANGANGKRFPAVAKGPTEDTDPTFSADGTSIAYVANRQVFLKDMTKKDATAVPLTDPGDKFSDLAWAPTVDQNVIAMFRDKSPGGKNEDQDLCLLRVLKEPQAPQCISEPDFNVEKVVRWSYDGKSIFALGVKPNNTGFGIVRWRSKKPFSADRNDWGKGRFVTDVSNPVKGVIDWSPLPPDGKTVAVVANFDSDAFQLYFAKAKDFPLADAKPQGVRACKVAPRSDGKEIVVVQEDQFCSEANGQLARMPVKNPRAGQTNLGFSGDNPAFQPLTLE
jgi:beta-lactam-binding protein with PASTA domain